MAKKLLVGIVASGVLFAGAAYADQSVTPAPKTKVFMGAIPDFICGGMNYCVEVDYSDKSGMPDDDDMVMLMQSYNGKEKDAIGVGADFGNGEFTNGPEGGLQIIQVLTPKINSTKNWVTINQKILENCTVNRDPAKTGIVRIGITKIAADKFTCMIQDAY